MIGKRRTLRCCGSQLVGDLADVAVALGADDQRPEGHLDELTWFRPSRLAISLAKSTLNPPVSES
jgi:hypothetical protein